MCDYYTTINKKKVFCEAKAICEVDVKGCPPIEYFWGNWRLCEKHLEDLESKSYLRILGNKQLV